MSSLDYILIIIAILYFILFTFKALSLQKVNNSYEIFQKHKPNKSDLLEILNHKSPTIITGEVEDWYIFDKNDKIVDDKLNNKTLNDSTNNLCYILPIVRKYNFIKLNSKHQTNIITEQNTKHFLVLLEGELSIYLFNPEQKNNINKNTNIYQNNNQLNLKYMEVKLYAEQILYIPYQWHYCYQCLTDCKVLDVNSENLLTLPYKIFKGIKK